MSDQNESNPLKDIYLSSAVGKLENVAVAVTATVLTANPLLGLAAGAANVVRRHEMRKEAENKKDR